MKHQMLSKMLLSTVVVTGSIAVCPLIMDKHVHAEQKSDNIGKLNQKMKVRYIFHLKKALRGLLTKTVS